MAVVLEHCGSFKNSETPREERSDVASMEERAEEMFKPLSSNQDCREKSNVRKKQVNFQTQNSHDKLSNNLSYLSPPPKRKLV